MSFRDRMTNHAKDAKGGGSAGWKFPSGVEVTLIKDLFDRKNSYADVDFLTYIVTMPAIVKIDARDRKLKEQQEDFCEKHGWKDGDVIYADDRKSGDEIVLHGTHPDGMLPGDEWYRLPFGQHFLPGSKVPVICPGTIGKPCPICEAHAKHSAKNTMTQGELNKIKLKDNVAYPVLLTNSDDVVILQGGMFALGEPLAKEIDALLKRNPDHPVADFCLQRGGSTAEISLEEKTFKSDDGGGKFVAVRRVDFKDRGNLAAAIYDDVPDLDDCLVVLSYEELEAMYLRGASEDSNDDEPPARGRGRGRREEPAEDEGGRSSRRDRGRDDNRDDAPENRGSSRRDRGGEDEGRSSRRGGDDNVREERGGRNRREESVEEPKEERGGRQRRDRSEPADDDAPASRAAGRQRRDRGGDDDKGRDEKEDRGGDDCSYGHRFGTDFMNKEDCDDCADLLECRKANRGR